MYNTVQCTMYTVHCTVQCTLYIVLLYLLFVFKTPVYVSYNLNMSYFFNNALLNIIIYLSHLQLFSTLLIYKNNIYFIKNVI